MRGLMAALILAGIVMLVGGRAAALAAAGEDLRRQVG